jgi:excisionase family DNA binding protein
MANRKEIDMDLETVTTPELAGLLKISERTLLKWRAEGVGPNFKRVGRRVLYRRSDVASWLDKQ